MGIAPERVAAILLAGGRSERFGGDKLAHQFRGRPLAAHAAMMLGELPFLGRIAVVGPTEAEFPGFDIRRLPAGGPMSASLRDGIAAARETGCDAALIVLADMPLVPSSHVRALLAAYAGAITATLADGRAMVPAILPRGRFAEVVVLEGDQGARALLRGAAGVEANPNWLVDIDTPDDLAAHDRPGHAR